MRKYQQNNEAADGQQINNDGQRSTSVSLNCRAFNTVNRERNY